MSMPMTFNTDNLATQLLSTSWAPATLGQYVGSWFFIFVLAIIWRALVYVQRRLDQHWIRKYSSAAHKEVLREIPDVAHLDSDLALSVQAWRLSVNLPRAALAYVVQSISYLLYVFFLLYSFFFLDGLSLMNAQNDTGHDDECGLLFCSDHWVFHWGAGVWPAGLEDLVFYQQAYLFIYSFLYPCIRV